MNVKLLNTPKLPYNLVHTLQCLKSTLNFVETEDFKVGVILDPEIEEETLVREQAHICKANKKKVVYMVYDPFGFIRAEKLTDEGLIDQIFVFDSKFTKRFPKTKTTLSEYVMNDSMFPTVFPEVKINNLCYFGHLKYMRKLPPNCVHLESSNTISGFKRLYEEVAKYKGAVVFTSGISDDGSHLVSYNKGKIPEILLCGVCPYVANKIQSVSYSEFITFDLGDPIPVNIEQIRKINRDNVLKLCNSIIS